MKAKPKNKNILNGPETSYLKKRRIRFFPSFEKMNEADATEKASLPPEDHLRNATERIQKIYEEELKKPMDKKIKFRK